MKVLIVTQLRLNHFEMTNKDPVKMEYKWGNFKVIVDEQGYDYINGNPEQVKQLEELMESLNIPRTKQKIEINNDIPAKLLNAGFEYDEENKEYCQSFKTHDVCMNDKGMVSFYVDEDDFNHFMSDQVGRIQRWTLRFRKYGIEMAGVEGVFKQ